MRAALNEILRLSLLLWTLPRGNYFREQCKRQRLALSYGAPLRPMLAAPEHTTGDE